MLMEKPVISVAVLSTATAAACRAGLTTDPLLSTTEFPAMSCTAGLRMARKVLLALRARSM
jgi:hypothetical protein